MLNSPLIEHHAAYDIWNCIRHQQLTIEWLALVFREFFGENVDFLDALFLYRWFPDTEVSHGCHGEFSGELPIMEVENDAFTLNDSICHRKPIWAFTEEFWFLHQGFSDDFWTIEYDNGMITKS